MKDKEKTAEEIVEEVKREDKQNAEMKK